MRAETKIVTFLLPEQGMKTLYVNNRFPTYCGSRPAACYRSNKFGTIFYCFSMQTPLVNLWGICLGGLGWSSDTVRKQTFVALSLISKIYFNRQFWISVTFMFWYCRNVSSFYFSHDGGTQNARTANHGIASLATKSVRSKGWSL